jgi:hypothetical protein
MFVPTVPKSSHRLPLSVKGSSKGVAIIATGLALLVVSVVVTANSDSSTSTTGAADSLAAMAGVQDKSNSAIPNEEICRVADSAGSYYLNVTSEPSYRASACSGAEPFSGAIHDLLNLPGVHRRCILGSDYAVTSTHAVVSVYSDGEVPNLSAAKAFCYAHGGTQLATVPSA